MSDLDDLLRDRIDGVRSNYTFELAPLDDGTEGADVSVQYEFGGLVAVVIPTCADGVLMLEVHGFVDGQRRDDATVLLRSN